MFVYYIELVEIRICYLTIVPSSCSSIRFSILLINCSLKVDRYTKRDDRSPCDQIFKLE